MLRRFHNVRARIDLRYALAPAIVALLVVVRILRRDDFSLSAEIHLDAFSKSIAAIADLALSVLLLMLLEIVVLAGLVLVISFIKQVLQRRVLSEDNSQGQDYSEVECARLSFSSYRRPNQNVINFRYVDRFWLEGGVFGLIRRRCNKIFVVFRGTSEMGNWFLTNAQAHMTDAKNLLGGNVDGGVHQGFGKAFADLWLVRLPKSLPPTVNYERTKNLWPLLMAVYTAVPSILVAHLRPALFSPLNWYWILLLVVTFLSVIQLGLSSGKVESSFLRRRRLVLGPALSRAVPHDGSMLIFTGHSLGGSLATLAFVEYCERTKDESARLVTFGAPRVGDDKFVNWMREHYSGRFTFIADRGDPVAYLPPSRTFFSEGTHKVSLLSAFLVAVYTIVWLPYALCYRVDFKTQWADITNWRGRDLGWAIRKHGVYRAIRRLGNRRPRRAPIRDSLSE